MDESLPRLRELEKKLQGLLQAHRMAKSMDRQQAMAGLRQHIVKVLAEIDTLKKTLRTQFLAGRRTVEKDPQRGRIVR